MSKQDPYANFSYDPFRTVKQFGALVEAGAATDSQRASFEDAVTQHLVKNISSSNRTDCYDAWIVQHGYRVVTNADPLDDVFADMPSDYAIVAPDGRLLTTGQALCEIAKQKWPEVFERVDIDRIKTIAAAIR